MNDDVLLVALAGGRGTRLRPLTDNCPKPLLLLDGCSGIEHAFRKATDAGISHVAVIGHYLFDQIERTVEHMPEKPENVSLVRELYPLGSGGCLSSILHMEFAELVVLFTDVFFETPLSVILKTHRQEQAVMTLGTTGIKFPIPFGVVISDDARVTRFDEQFCDVRVFTGVAVIQRSFLLNVNWGSHFGFNQIVNVALNHSIPIMEVDIQGWKHLTQDMVTQLKPISENNQ